MEESSFQGKILLGVSSVSTWGSLGAISQGSQVQPQGLPSPDSESPQGTLDCRQGRGRLTMSWKKNQACCRTASRTALPLTTHCRASSS